MYLYKSLIYHDTTNVVDLPADNATDIADFEGATKKPNALSIDSLELSETTFELSKDYTAFDALIDGTDILWSDVKYIDDGKAYCLILASENEL